ncbi:MAG: hypothetical protein EOS78_03105 [Mesorhizobium sp.]|nr:MAG: hypothetical protein EOS78_03105 [Mesorhizobium sp.]
MVNNSAAGVFRPSKKALSIIVVAMTSLVAGCQVMDATNTGSVIIAPAVHPVQSRPPVQSFQAGYVVRSLRAEPQVLMTSTIRTTERTYAFAPPPITTRTLGPVKVAFNPVDDATFSGSSPYICSPSGFGQRASCRARSL